VICLDLLEHSTQRDSSHGDPAPLNRGTMLCPCPIETTSGSAADRAGLFLSDPTQDRVHALGAGERSGRNLPHRALIHPSLRRSSRHRSRGRLSLPPISASPSCGALPPLSRGERGSSPSAKRNEAVFATEYYHRGSRGTAWSLELSCPRLIARGHSVTLSPRLRRGAVETSTGVVVRFLSAPSPPGRGSRP